jgi:hypothetical protein
MVLNVKIIGLRIKKYTSLFWSMCIMVFLLKQSNFFFVIFID